MGGVSKDGQDRLLVGDIKALQIRRRLALKTPCVFAHLARVAIALTEDWSPNDQKEETQRLVDTHWQAIARAQWSLENPFWHWQPALSTPSIAATADAAD